MTVVGGIDIGGTNMLAALVDDDHQLIEQAKYETPATGPDAVVGQVAQIVSEFKQRPAAIGIGIPGPVSNGVVTRPPNLGMWPSEVPLADKLAEVLDLPVEVGNDVNVAALGEWVAGAGRGANFMLGVWMGTGVGGGLILDGRPYTGAFGGAGEFGHMIVHAGGAQCGCGRRGCIEAYAGRASLERAVALAVGGGRQTNLLEIRDRKGRDRLTSAVWAKALKEGDSLATELFDAAVDAIAIGVGSAINLLDLDRVVIGGGLAERFGQNLADRIAAAAQPWTLVPDAQRQVVTAELGEASGAVGAAALARAVTLVA